MYHTQIVLSVSSEFAGDSWLSISAINSQRIAAESLLSIANNDSINNNPGQIKENTKFPFSQS